jgi:hypothetical protein
MENQKDNSNQSKEYALNDGDDTVVNVAELENKMLKNILDYGKFLNWMNESCSYLDFNLVSFEEFMNRRPLSAVICHFAYSLFVIVENAKRLNFEKKNIKSGNTAINSGSVPENICPGCGAGLYHQDVTYYCPICAYSKSE